MDTIEEILTRGVANIIPDREKLKELMESGKKLNVYLGIDPTATAIHLGHAVPLRKLQAFADMGHTVTFLIGDFTALIGDTSDKDSERPSLTSQEIEKNFRTYKSQAQKVLDFDKVKIQYNSEWLGELKFKEVIKLCHHFSAGDFVGRELIKKRLTEGKKVGLHELLYPVMQGYDSYTLDTDIQIGGTDQTFNMQAGRTLIHDLRNKQSFIIANAFLTGTDGRKMSKTWGNAIWLNDEPNEMFGKVMSLRDELIVEYFTLATTVSMEQIAEAEKRLKSGVNPMVLKKELARRIVMELHTEELAELSEEYFETRFQKGDLGNVDLPTVSLKVIVGGGSAAVNLVAVNLVGSKSEARRLINEHAVEVNGKPVTSASEVLKLKSGDIIKVGKKRSVKIT